MLAPSTAELALLCGLQELAQFSFSLQYVHQFFPAAVDPLATTSYDEVARLGMTPKLLQGTFSGHLQTKVMSKMRATPSVWPRLRIAAGALLLSSSNGVSCREQTQRHIFFPWGFPLYTQPANEVTPFRTLATQRRSSSCFFCGCLGDVLTPTPFLAHRSNFLI